MFEHAGQPTVLTLNAHAASAACAECVCACTRVCVRVCAYVSEEGTHFNCSSINDSISSRSQVYVHCSFSSSFMSHKWSTHCYICKIHTTLYTVHHKHLTTNHNTISHLTLSYTLFHIVHTHMPRCGHKHTHTHTHTQTQYICIFTFKSITVYVSHVHNGRAIPSNTSSTNYTYWVIRKVALQIYSGTSLIPTLMEQKLLVRCPHFRG